MPARTRFGGRKTALLWSLDSPVCVAASRLIVCREVSPRSTSPRPVLPAPFGSVVPAFVAGCEAVLPIVKNGKPSVVLKIDRVRSVVMRARHRA